MSTIDALIDDARRLLHSPGWNHARLANATGLRCYDIIGIDRPEWNPPADVLRSLERLLIRQRKNAFSQRGGDVAASGSHLGGAFFDRLANRYIRDGMVSGRRCAGQECSLLLRHVLPHWSGLRVEDISERHVVELMDTLKAELSPSFLTRVYRVTSNVFRLAVRRGLIAQNPCRDFRPPTERVVRHRVLRPGEIATLWNGLCLATNSPQARLALLWQLVTAQRISAVRQAEALEIDATWPSWSIPKERMKGGRLHIVPLSSLALRLLPAIEAARKGSPYLFPSQPFGGDRPLTKSGIQGAMRQACRGMAERATSHDLRRTAATSMVRLGVSRTVVQKVLGHKDSLVIAAYDVHDYEAEKRQALELWGCYLVDLIGDGLVVRALSELQS